MSSARRPSRTPCLRRRTAAAALGCGLALAAAACGRGDPAAPEPATGVAEQAPAPDEGFLAPPAVLLAQSGPDGTLHLQGHAHAGAQVRLVAPDGASSTARAGPDGRWAARLPEGSAPRMYALSALADGRVLRGEGALAVVPWPGRTAVLTVRSGAPALPLGQDAGGGGPRLVSLDFDAAGGFAASGFARPGAPVRVMLDGAPAGQGAADGRGRFAVLGIAATITPGRHGLAVESPQGRDAADVEVAPAPPLAAPFRATRTAAGWRLDWAAPAGGVQSLLVFDPEAASQAPSVDGSAGA